MQILHFKFYRTLKDICRLSFLDQVEKCIEAINDFKWLSINECPRKILLSDTVSMLYHFNIRSYVTVNLYSASSLVSDLNNKIMLLTIGVQLSKGTANKNVLCSKSL